MRYVLFDGLKKRVKLLRSVYSLTIPNGGYSPSYAIQFCLNTSSDPW